MNHVWWPAIAMLIRILLMAVVTPALTSPAVAFPNAQPVSVEAPLVAQRFAPPEWTGRTWDDGTYDCVPATVAMALQSLERTGAFSGPSADFAAVRGLFRKRAPNAHQGMSVKLVIDLTPTLSENRLHAELLFLGPERWQETIREELGAGFPIIAQINDWSRLAGRWAPKGLSHAVVISGLEGDLVRYNDPWDGKSYTLSTRDFANAWGYAPPSVASWIAVVFRRGPGEMETASPPRGPPPLPSAQLLLAESLTAMRAQSTIRATGEADLLFVRGSGRIALALPDEADGEGTVAGLAWSVSTSGARRGVQVGGRYLGDLAGTGAAQQATDAILQSVGAVPNWTIREEASSYHLEASLSADELEAIVGTALHGRPAARLSLTVGRGTNVWERLELEVSWPVAGATIFGYHLEAGPAASARLDFELD